MPKLFASKDGSVSVRERRNMERARRIAAQGMVLLENNGILPFLDHARKIALFGNGARHTVKGGTGSGDVNSRFVVNVEQGLLEAGFVVTTKDWLDRYDKAVEEAKNTYDARLRAAVEKEGKKAAMRIFTDPFTAPPVVAVTQGDVDASDTDTAIYVLARNSGEGRDRNPGAGDFLLCEQEKAAILFLTGHYAHVVVVLNVGGVVDTSFLRSTKGIDAVLLMSQAGNVSGYALADVLLGKENPSGHLASTWAEAYGDYPSALTFGHMNKNLDDEYYTEGIYVGYRYFDTFNVAPAYPFGYGLSYTTFAIQAGKVCVDEKRVAVEVTVQNTGTKFSGREVVQVYYSAPNGRLEKPYQELCAYAKTKKLGPGESQTLTLSYPVADMASYDESQAAYVLEAGTYYVRVGSDSRSTHVVAALELDREAVTQRLRNCLVPDDGPEVLLAKGIVPYGYAGEKAEMEAAERFLLCSDKIPCSRVQYSTANEEIKTSKSQKLTMDDVREGRALLEDLTAQLTVEEMACLCVGTARGGFGGDSVIGAASTLCPGAAGDTTPRMTQGRNIRNIVLADGPAGLRLSRHFMADRDGNVIPGTDEAGIPGMELLGMPKPEIPKDATDYYQYCTAIPIATLLAQTWDVEALEEAGDIVGEEMLEFGVTLWLAPGMNIHRNPLCGRNFEYYSEDPLVAGLCAAADTRGVQKHAGVGTTIKHFAFNNQEDNRMHTNAHIGERAIREIYLKGFEIAVKQSQPLSIMTSYNLINGVHTANSFDLITAIARDEWGFAGIVMTDWGTTGGMEMEPDKTFRYGCSSAAGCIKAGNDLIMPGRIEDVEEIVASVEAKTPITLGDLQACAKRILRIIAQSRAYA